MSAKSLLRHTSTSTLICALLIGLMLPSAMIAQQRDDFLRPFIGFYDSQSLSTAIGNATVAAGQIIPGRSSNPANLGLNRFGNLQFNFQNNDFNGSGASNSTTNFGGVYTVLPVRVYQGSLVFGGGVQRIIDFTNASANSTTSILEEGGMYATEFSVAVEASENLFIGASFNYLSGSNELSRTEPDLNSFLNPEYSGYNFTLGFINRATPYFHLGASVQFPTKVEVQDNLTTWTDDSPGDSDFETWNYTLRRPMVFHLGFSVLYAFYSVFYEMEWSDWQGLEFASSDYFEGDVAEINREIMRELRSALTHHVGAALHLPWLPLHVYGGYQFIATPFTGVYDGNRRQSVSLGGSYLLNQQFSIHSSYSRYYWKYKGQAESYSMLVAGVSYHF